RRALAGMAFSGWVLCLGSLVHALYGLYPYAVNGTFTLSEISGKTSPDVLLGGLIAYLVFYGIFLLGFFQLLKHIERYGVLPVARTRGRA
ncbi:MAG TPA: cytochrome ubiquinol oxidase subunit I, partial [Paralcaligenes sp.]